MTQDNSPAEQEEIIRGLKGSVMIRRDYRHQVTRIRIFEPGRAARIVTNSGLANQYQPLGYVFDVFEAEQLISSYNSLDDARRVAQILVELDRNEWDRHL